MYLQTYQAQSQVTWRGQEVEVRDHQLAYLALGASNEVGELMGKIRPLLRVPVYHGMEQRRQLAGEMGDVLWYLSQFCTYMSFNLADLMANQVARELPAHHDSLDFLALDLGAATGEFTGTVKKILRDRDSVPSVGTGSPCPAR